MGSTLYQLCEGSDGHDTSSMARSTEVSMSEGIYGDEVGLDQLMTGMGSDGILPLDQKQNAEFDGSSEPVIPTHIVMLVSDFDRLSFDTGI